MGFLSSFTSMFSNQTVQLSLLSAGIGLLLFFKDRKLDIIDSILLLMSLIGMILWVLEINGIRGYFNFGFSSEGESAIISIANTAIYLLTMTVLSVLPIVLIRDKRSGDKKKEPLSTITLLILMSVVVFSVIPQFAAQVSDGGFLVKAVMFLVYLIIIYAVSTPE